MHAYVIFIYLKLGTIMKTKLTGWGDDWLDVCMLRKGLHALFFAHTEDQTLLYEMLHLDQVIMSYKNVHVSYTMIIYGIWKNKFWKQKIYITIYSFSSCF